MEKKNCTYCKKYRNIIEFITNGKETKTCAACKEYKRNYAKNKNTANKKNNSLKLHMTNIKNNTENCDDCDEYFIKDLRPKLVNIYNSSGSIRQYFGRIRSIKKRDVLLKDGTFIKICNICRTDRIVNQRKKPELTLKLPTG